jgi:adenine/guanine phosphoribosyltransferase-like PRPP-binding protein
LIIERTEPAGLAIVVNSLAPFQSKIGQECVDSPLIVRAIESSSKPLEGGIFWVAPFMELRDDAQFRDAYPNADSYSDMLAHSDYRRQLVAIALWDPHSAKGVEILRHNFEKRQRLVHIHNFTAMKSFADAFRKDLDIETHKEDYIVVAPDGGSLHRSMLLANELRLRVALFDKTRPDVGDVEFGNLYIAGADGKVVAADESVIRGKKILIMDDLYATTKTAVVGAKRLKEVYGVAQIHFAATHAAYVMPEAEQYLGEALRKKILDSAYVTDTLPSCGWVKGVKVVSFAYPMSLVMKVAGGVASISEVRALEPYYFDPGPDKDIIKKRLKDGQLDLRPERWEWLHPPLMMKPWGLIYHYWRGKDIPELYEQGMDYAYPERKMIREKAGNG